MNEPAHYQPKDGDEINFLDWPVASDSIQRYTLNFQVRDTIITIHPDGKVTLSDKIKDVDEASRLFWEAVTHCGIKLATENAALKQRVEELENQLLFNLPLGEAR